MSIQKAFNSLDRNDRIRFSNPKSATPISGRPKKYKVIDYYSSKTVQEFGTEEQAKEFILQEQKDKIKYGIVDNSFTYLIKESN